MKRKTTTLVSEELLPGKTFTLVPPPRETVADRMKEHKRVLSAMGVTDLSSLGTLEISGAVIPDAGIFIPGMVVEDQPPLVARAFYSARRAGIDARLGLTNRDRLVSSPTIVKFSGTADLLKARRFPMPSTLPINTAYWAATSIVIADDTTIILQPPHLFLVMIAPQIKIGRNVTITWQREVKTVPDPPDPPLRPPQEPRSTSRYASKGKPGVPGGPGGPGWEGDPGPEIEIWTLNMEGDNPVLDVAGQDGFDGGRGGNGGPGGHGQPGRERGPDCDPPAGISGWGGDGGKAGDGGLGGNGGHGGKYSFYAPGETILRFVAQGFYIDASGGARGRGGLPGDPGPGGGWGVFDYPDATGLTCEDDGWRGQPGQRGTEGSPGLDGKPGGHYSNALGLVPIDEETFWIEFEAPHIMDLSVHKAVEGDVIAVFGERFTSADVVLVGKAGIESSTTFESPTELSFIVPPAEGGKQPVRVRQLDGTLSNRDTLRILPVVHHAEQQQDGEIVRSTDTPPARFGPGSQVKLVGSGFAPRVHIQVLDQYVTDSDVQYIDSQTLVFKLVRPVSTPRATDTADAAGDAEPVEVHVVLATAETSSPITLLLDTFKLVVFGDSITWGQGLQEPYKFHSLVEQYIRDQRSDIGVYKTVRAHSGAVIGANRSEVASKPQLPGEINTGEPTIIQQVNAYQGNPDAVDLILLDGGINDIPPREILNPLAESNLVEETKQHCLDDMNKLLTQVMVKFKKARVVVTGYYRIVAEGSDLDLLAAYLSYCFFWPLGGVGWVIGHVISEELMDKMVERSRIFKEEANANLKKAVDEINANRPSEYEGPGVLFADPLFGPAHAIFMPNSWLWGLNPDLSPQDTPEAGGVAPERAEQCNCAPPDRLADGQMVCARASAGHPNVRGAVEYANAIKQLPILH
jgi:lysophospholipase L1-like esterase